MGIIGSKLSRRVSPTIDIADDETTISTSAIMIESTSKSVPSHHPLINKLIVIWLDANVNDADDVYQNSINRLQRMTTSIHTFTNINDCTQFLNTIKGEKILMVVSNEFINHIWPRIKSMPQVHSVYIISQNGEAQNLPNIESDKIKGIFSKVEPVSGSVKRDNSDYKQDSLIMSVIPSMKYTKKDLKKLNRLFIYWMMVKIITLHLNYERDAHKEALKNLVEFSRHQYFNDADQLKIIEEFEQNYHQHSPVWWYTRNCFISSILNRAFQTQDIEIMIRMSCFIKDLHLQLERLQIETLKNNKLPITVYKTHNVTDEDFEKIKAIKGHILSFNSFIIGEPDYEKSLNVARRVQTNNSGIGVIFRMKIESKSTSTTFASLENISYSSQQGKSILFSMHSIFRIVDIKEIENRVWEVELTLTPHGDEQVRCLTELLKEETQGSSGWLKLPELMTIIRDFDQAKDIYYTILQLTPESDVLKRARIYNELGNIEDILGDYASALVFYQKAIHIRQQHLPPNHRSLSVSYNNIGEAQRQLGDYFNALSTHQKTLSIKRQTLAADDLSLATTYNNIALANESLGEFSAALDFHQKALSIKQKSLPPDHQEIGTAYNNIAELQRSMGQYPAALENLEKALNIRLKKYSPQDPSLGIPYNNLGLIHRELGDYPKALAYLEKSLDIKVKTLSSNHPSLTFTYNNIGDINQQLGHFNNALTSYQKALDIQLKVFSESHPEVATTYTNIGAAHQSMGQYTTALSFYQKAVKIRQKTLPANHPSLGTCFNNIGHCYQLMGEYNTALEHYQKTLKLQEKSLRPQHPSVAVTYNNLADVYRKLGNHTKALPLYKKSLEIKKKSLPPQHPTLIITYNNIGVIHQATKNHPAALECYKQTLEIQQKTLPVDHPDLAAVYNNMGVSYQSMKEYSTAFDYYKKALEIQEKALPALHPDIATTHNSMATVYINLGDYKSALEQEQLAVDIASQSLAADHPNLKLFRSYLERIESRIKSNANSKSN